MASGPTDLLGVYGNGEKWVGDVFPQGGAVALLCSSGVLGVLRRPCLPAVCDLEQVAEYLGASLSSLESMEKHPPLESMGEMMVVATTVY